MGKTSPHRLSDDVVTLGRALRPRERSELCRALGGLLRFQRDLGPWPKVRAAPDATPYVSLYASGALRGCYGSHEGAPNERLARAFLRALGDARYGGISASERVELAADVAYVTRATPHRADEAADVLEPGTHGVALVASDVATVLLPSVARERGYDARGVLDLLAKKTGTTRAHEGLVWVLDVCEVSSRALAERDPRRGARRFLESLVARDGAVTFAIAPGTGAPIRSGEMRHGRIAVVVEALAALDSPKARVAAQWLAREIDRGLGRRAVEGFPDRPDVILGTLALAARAGLDVPLATYAATADAATCSPWHAAQAAAALGRATPVALWRRVTESLAARPFSPYALFAARAREDAAITEQCARAIVRAIQTNAPFAGGAAITPVAETAMTAVAIDALAPLAPRDAEARRAVRAARAFVAARQILDVPAALHPATLGAFRASPIAPIFRCDITAHAALAIVA